MTYHVHSSIGTGLFVGSGSILSLVGPLPLWLGYLSMMSIVWVVMNDLGEMVTFLPLKGISIPYLVQRFVDPSLAFACGWNYFYAYGMLVAAETTAGSILLDYWKTLTPLWITIILLVILLLNIIAVEVFGEAEFWFASIKLITIMGLVVLGIVLMAGGGPNHDVVGFRYWNNPGAINEYMTTGATGRFLAYWTAFVRAGFAFITSPELIAVAAGETVAPRRNIPKAVKRFIWRLALFYGVSTLILGCIVPSTDSQLLSATSDASASPWVIAIQNAGIGSLNHIINFAILTSAWSAGNAFLYSGSRVLYSMSLTNQAPKFFSATSRNGVPYLAVLATWSFGLLAYLNISKSGAVVFLWFSNISTISGFIAWIVVLITYLRFRAAMEFRGILHTLPFRTALQPYGSYYALFIIILLTLTNGFQVFFPSQWSVSDFLAAYITIPIFLALYFGHKLWFRTSFAIPKEDIDVVTGVREMDELAAMDVSPTAKNWIEKVWFWIA
jgi:amino acid transporter